MEIKKNEAKFVCQPCDFKCSNKSDWERHVSRAKHRFSVNGNQKKREKREKQFLCNCGKKYLTNSGLWKHQSKNYCLTNEESENDDKEKKITSESDKDLIMMLVKQNSELLEVLKQGTHHTTNNTINKTFNLQLFLNETCKEAMNIQDFIDNIEIELNDLLTMGKQGYVEGISRIITSNLKALDISKRPIHCTDKKREILYIKDSNKWEKDENKLKINDMIGKISEKNISFLSENQVNLCELKMNENYNNILLESFRPQSNDSYKNENIIKNISKHVFIEK